MKFVTNAWASNEHRVCYCLVDFNQATLDMIKKRLDVAKQLVNTSNSSFVYSAYFDSSVTYFDYFDALGDYPMQHDAFVVVSGLNIPENCLIRVECPTMLVYPTCVLWEAYLRFTDAKVATANTFTLAFFEKLLREYGHDEDDV